MPYLTWAENLTLQLSPGLVASYDIQPGNGVGLFWGKHTHVYLLTSHGPTRGYARGFAIRRVTYNRNFMGCIFVQVHPDRMIVQ